LDYFGEREPAGPWSWHSPARTATGRARGGCLEVIEETFIAGRFSFAPEVLDGSVLLLETSERTTTRLFERKSASPLLSIGNSKVSEGHVRQKAIVCCLVFSQLEAGREPSGGSVDLQDDDGVRGAAWADCWDGVLPSYAPAGRVARAA